MALDASKPQENLKYPDLSDHLSTMSGATASEKVASDPKTTTLNQEAKPEDNAPRIVGKGDDALQLLESAAVLDSLDPHISKRLLRRIDLYIMPLICM